MRDSQPFERTLYVRDTCLCLSLQRAARALARLFDEAFRPLGLTNGQFSLLMSLNRPRCPTMGEVAALLAMDRTTLTAALKPLERRGLVKATEDKEDKRARRLSLTDAGRDLLEQAYPLWETTHQKIDAAFSPSRINALRRDLKRLAFGDALKQKEVG
jgi:DNA-binding MarR family transcriptional regulator